MSTAATNMLLAIVALATGVLAARLLGPESRGHLAAAQAVGSLVAVLGALAMGEALVFSIGRRHRSPLAVLRTATVFASGSSAIAIAAAALLMPWFLAGQPEAVGPARAYSLIGLIFVLLGFPITYLRARQRYKAWNRHRIISPLCWLAVLGLFTVIGVDRVLALVVAFVLAQSIFIPLIWYRLGRAAPSESRSFDGSLIMPMLRYGAPLLMATLPQVLNVRLDQIVIANLETADQLGLYAVSVSWAGLGLTLLGAVGSILFPKLAAMDEHEARGALAAVIRPAVVLALVVGATSALAAPVAVPALFGSSFRVPVELPMLLACASSIMGLNMVIEEGLRGLGETRSVLVGEMTGLTVTVGSLLFLVPRLGITGAAVGSLAGGTVVCSTLTWQISRRIGIPAAELLIPRVADCRALANRLRASVAARTGST